eukprot:4528994-Pleurochrysis_carterae.AAC.1
MRLQRVGVLCQTRCIQNTRPTVSHPFCSRVQAQLAPPALRPVGFAAPARCVDGRWRLRGDAQQVGGRERALRLLHVQGS